MVGDMGHMGGLINPRPGRGQYRAGFSNTGGSPKPQKRAPCKKTWVEDVEGGLNPLKSKQKKEEMCIIHRR